MFDSLNAKEQIDIIKAELTAIHSQLGGEPTKEGLQLSVIICEVRDAIAVVLDDATKWF